LAPLEPKLARNLKRGGGVDARLDLHGYRQDEAHSHLISFLKNQQSRGARVVLVITGKSGILNRMVPAWLAEPALRAAVIGFSEASAKHGGSGAMYVRLRRER
jgi:DNA-nicking Smr family endonuclease